VDCAGGGAGAILIDVFATLPASSVVVPSMSRQNDDEVGMQPPE